MSEVKLEPCPHCGEVASVEDAQHHEGLTKPPIEDGRYYVRCMAGCLALKHTTAEAIAAWNTRPAPPAGPTCPDCHTVHHPMNHCAPVPAPSEAVREALEALANADCGDSLCVFVENKTGQRTNGGCRCFGERTNMKKFYAIKEMAAQALRRLSAPKSGCRCQYDSAVGEYCLCHAAPGLEEMRKALESVKNELLISVNLHEKERHRNAALGPGYPQGPCQCDDCKLYAVVIAALSPAPSKEKI